ncbi:hypothetical protein [Paenibacillus sp. HB172176]|uniref:hypothetical protein n=1 Tax=Paenibacillus sp. HB172176 TaxID=2493690 RepID=UPI00143BE8D0|nr:hypothetical protein [Paenibacillus sp. HB172176]
MQSEQTKIDFLCDRFKIKCEINDDGSLDVKMGNIFFDICRLLQWDSDKIKILVIDYVNRKILRDSSRLSEREIKLINLYEIRPIMEDTDNVLDLNYYSIDVKKIEDINEEDVKKIWEVINFDFNNLEKYFTEKGPEHLRNVSIKHLITFIKNKGFEADGIVYVQKFDFVPLFFLYLCRQFNIPLNKRPNEAKKVSVESEFTKKPANYFVEYAKTTKVFFELMAESEDDYFDKLNILDEKYNYIFLFNTYYKLYINNKNSSPNEELLDFLTSLSFIEDVRLKLFISSYYINKSSQFFNITNNKRKLDEAMGLIVFFVKAYIPLLEHSIRKATQNHLVKSHETHFEADKNISIATDEYTEFETLILKMNLIIFLRNETIKINEAITWLAVDKVELYDPKILDSLNNRILKAKQKDWTERFFQFNNWKDYIFYLEERTEEDGTEPYSFDINGILASVLIE